MNRIVNYAYLIIISFILHILFFIIKTPIDDPYLILTIANKWRNGFVPYESFSIPVGLITILPLYLMGIGVWQWLISSYIFSLFLIFGVEMICKSEFKSYKNIIPLFTLIITINNFPYLWYNFSAVSLIALGLGVIIHRKSNISLINSLAEGLILALAFNCKQDYAIVGYLFAFYILYDKSKSLSSAFKIFSIYLIILYLVLFFLNNEFQGYIYNILNSANESLQVYLIDRLITYGFSLILLMILISYLCTVKIKNNGTGITNVIYLTIFFIILNLSTSATLLLVQNTILSYYSYLVVVPYCLFIKHTVDKNIVNNRGKKKLILVKYDIVRILLVFILTFSILMLSVSTGRDDHIWPLVIIFNLILYKDLIKYYGFIHLKIIRYLKSFNINIRKSDTKSLVILNEKGFILCLIVFFSISAVGVRGVGYFSYFKSDTPYIYKKISSFFDNKNNTVSLENFLPTCIDRDDLFKIIEKNNIIKTSTVYAAWPVDWNYLRLQEVKYGKNVPLFPFIQSTINNNNIASLREFINNINKQADYIILDDMIADRFGSDLEENWEDQIKRNYTFYSKVCLYGIPNKMYINNRIL